MLATFAIGSCEISITRDHARELDTLVVRDRQGKVREKLQNYRLGFLGVERNPSNKSVLDLNRDGAPEAIFETWSGGAHGSARYVIWSLGSKPYRMLHFDKGNVWGDERDFKLVDLDRDRVPEILTWYDGFAYAYANAYTAPIPMVLKLSHGRYLDATHRFPEILRKEQAMAWRSLESAAKRKEPIDHAVSHGPDVVWVVALAELRGNRRETFSRLRGTLSAEDCKWAERQLPFVRKTLAARQKRLIR